MNNNHIAFGVPLLALAKLVVVAMLLSTAAVPQEARISAPPQASPVAFAPPITPAEAVFNAGSGLVMPVGD